MILFKDDWNKYPDAVVHVSTKNKSFLNHHYLLKKINIKNNLFFLALHDKTLLNVDPHSETLTMDQKARVAKEIQINPWYFIREVVRAPAVSGEVKTPYKANVFNITLMWLFFLHIVVLGIAPRQTGKSFTVDVLMVGLTHFWTSNTVIGLVTKDIKLRVTNIERIKDIASELPAYLRMITKKDSDNSEGITVSLMGNRYITAIGRTSEVQARSVLRGQTMPIVHFDEVAFISNIDITLPSVLAAGNAAVDAAKVSKTPYGTLYTTTAGRKDTRSGKFVWDMYIEGMVWSDELLDLKDEEELRRAVEKTSRGPQPMIILDTNHRRLGYTDGWLKSKIQASRATGIDAETDFLNRWSDGTASSPLSNNLLKSITESAIHPNHTTISEEGYTLRWYISEDKRRQYRLTRTGIIGLDTSDAVGKDGIGLTIRDVCTGELICAGDFNETNLALFAEFLFNLLVEYDKFTLIVERKSSGMMIMDYISLLMGKVDMNPFKRMFNWSVDENAMSIKEYSDYDSSKGKFGYGTTGGTGNSSRNKLYNVGLLGSSKYTGSLTRDMKLVAEIKNLSVKNGRIDHSTDGHDDLVISHMLTWWFLTSAKNVWYYGIGVDTPLSEVTTYVESENKKKKSVKEKEYESNMKLVVKDIIDKLRSEDSNIVRHMLKKKLLYLNSKLDVDLSNSLNIHARLKDIK